MSINEIAERLSLYSYEATMFSVDGLTLLVEEITGCSAIVARVPKCDGTRERVWMVQLTAVVEHMLFTRHACSDHLPRAVYEVNEDIRAVVAAFTRRLESVR